VENKLHTIKNRIEYPLGLRQKFLPAAHFVSIFCCLNRDAFDLKFLVLSTNSLVVKMISTPILSDYNNTICTKQ